MIIFRTKFLNATCCGSELEAKKTLLDQNSNNTKSLLLERDSRVCMVTMETYDQHGNGLLIFNGCVSVIGGYLVPKISKNSIKTSKFPRNLYTKKKN